MEPSRQLARRRAAATALTRVTLTAAALTFFAAGALLAQDFPIVPIGSTAGDGSSRSPEAASLSPPATVSDSSSVAAAVVAYHRALATGDSAAALSLLTEDALILESGGIETRAEYRSHHLPSDIEFARAIQATESPVRVKVRGDVAWAASTNIAQGQFRGRPVNSVGAELMGLTRGQAGWKIAAIHWSSRARRP